MSTIRSLALGLALAATLPVHAETIYGISVPGAQTNLIRFDSATPAAVSTVGAIAGILPNHTLRAVDFRPSDGRLYALSSVGSTATAQLYTVDLATGAATPLGGGLTLTGNSSTRVSLDFNPVTGELRVVTGNGANYRVNADTGSVIARDTDIVTSGSGTTPLISGIAHSNNVVGATETTLFAYDFLADNLGRIGGVGGVPSSNGGVFDIIGSSGIVTGDAGAGFDISGATGLAYVSVDDFNGSAGFNAEFFSVNLATGALSQIGGDDLFSLLDFSVWIDTDNQVPAPASGVLVLSALALLGAQRRKAVQRSTAHPAQR